MKRMLAIVGTVMVLLILSFDAFANERGTARLSLVTGDVSVMTQDTGSEWNAATINLPLWPGDRVWVPRGGRAEIQFLGRTYVRADEDTEIVLSKMQWDRDSSIFQVGLSEGRVYVTHRASSARSSVLQVDTPLLSVTSYDDARYDVYVRGDGYVDVSVFSGVAYVESPRGRTRVDRGDMMSVSVDDYAEISPLGPRSDWIRWNESRDSRLARYRESSRYLPPELDCYSSDLDESGRWIYVADYGYVWRPTVVVAGWAPYRHGRWVWLRGDYVWISFDPWGWAPHHYGRWAFRVGFGWFWVPPAVNAVYWSPGFVAWISTPTYVSWVPLAPREIYYGYGYYGPYSVNLTKVNVKNVTVTNVYVNARVTNAVTVVHRDAFLTGRKGKGEPGPVNPFLRGAPGAPGRPDIRPAKTTIMPLSEKAVATRPVISPPGYDRIRSKGLDQRRVAVKREISVFRDDGRIDPLPVVKSAKPRSVTRDDRTAGDSSAPRDRTRDRSLQMPGLQRDTVRQPVPESPVRGPAFEQTRREDRSVASPRYAPGRGDAGEREPRKESLLPPRGLERRPAVPNDRGGDGMIRHNVPSGIERETKIKGSLPRPRGTEENSVPVRPGDAKNPRSSLKKESGRKFLAERGTFPR